MTNPSSRANYDEERHCNDGQPCERIVVPESPGSVTWRLLGASVRGAKHDRTGQPNQDAIGWFPKADEELGESQSPYIMVLADGHGQAKSFRSGVGANLAVEAAIEIVREFAKELDALSQSQSECKSQAEQWLPLALVNRWREHVADHLKENPIDEEIAQFVEDKTKPWTGKIRDDPFKAYGTTVVCAVVHDRYLLLLQLGDGKIFVVTHAGEVVQGLHDDPLNFANETTSISSSAAIQNVRVTYSALGAIPPIMILLCTDGYSNAFEPAQLTNVCREFVDALRTEGPILVQGYLRELLADASQRGSGDDATLGILFRLNVDYSRWPDRLPSEASVDGELQTGNGTQTSPDNASETVAPDISDHLRFPDKPGDSPTSDGSTEGPGLTVRFEVQPCSRRSTRGGSPRPSGQDENDR